MSRDHPHKPGRTTIRTRDFKEEIISEETKDGIYNRVFYISAYVLGEDVRVYCKYSVKTGVTNAPGLLNVRGWMSWPGINEQYSIRL